MPKESRLSFRISDRLNDEIERMVIIKREIRDRSDLGNQSCDFFLKLIKDKLFDEQIYLQALIKIADETGNGELPEILELKKMIEWYAKIAQNPVAAADVIYY